MAAGLADRTSPPRPNKDDTVAGNVLTPGLAPAITRLKEPDGALAAAIGRAQQGSEDAFRLLYRDIQPRVLRYLRTLVGEDAEDVASETWLHVARDLHGFRGDLDAFRGWVATIARNRATDHLRRASRRPRPATIPAEELLSVAATDDTATAAMNSVSTDTALGLIGTLPRDQAEAVLLRVVVGLDAKSAGRVLGKRPGAVRTAAYRGLRKLAAQLDHYGLARDAADAPAATARDTAEGNGD
jgi:RNA polymerase sigma-70 factor (ECF subfamily)